MSIESVLAFSPLYHGYIVGSIDHALHWGEWTLDELNFWLRWRRGVLNPVPASIEHGGPGA